MPAAVRYIGVQSRYEMTESMWARLGIMGPTLTWEKSNSWLMPLSDLPQTVVGYLKRDPNFAVVQTQMREGIQAPTHQSNKLTVRMGGTYDGGNPLWPLTWQTGTITGQYIDLAGNASEGSIIFEMTPQRIVVMSEEKIITPIALEFPLDENGALVAVMPAGNDLDINPTGWPYHVIENIPGGLEYDIDVQAGVSSDLSAVSAIPDTDGTLITRGVGITAASFNDAAHLILSMSDGSTIDVGVMGLDGGVIVPVIIDTDGVAYPAII